MLIRLRLNKPAVQKFCMREFNGGLRLANNIECSIDVEERFLLKPLWINKDEESEKGDYVSLEYLERGSANFWINGRITQSAIEALQNPYKNPFFSLIQAGEWVKAEPYVSFSEERISSPRDEPILRVIEISGYASDISKISAEKSADYQSTDFFFRKVMEAHKDVKQADQKQDLEDISDIKEARILLKKFEDVAKIVLPIYNDVRSMRRLIEKHL